MTNQIYKKNAKLRYVLSFEDQSLLISYDRGLWEKHINITGLDSSGTFVNNLQKSSLDWRLNYPLSWYYY